MPAGLDDIDWTRLDCAARGDVRGPATVVPGLLRRAASADDGTAGRALAELGELLHRDGEVFTATVAAVPFLIDLARTATHRRAEAVRLVGLVADPRRSRGAASADVRTAVAARAATLVPLLDDAEPGTRAAAAYALAQAGAAPGSLWARRAVEDDDAVRASVTLALGLRDPARFAQAAADVVAEPSTRVRAAAAVALHRAGGSWPDGTVSAVVDLLAAGAEIEPGWFATDIAEELVTGATADRAQALVAALLAAEQPWVRESGAQALAARCLRLRSAPAALLPLLRPLLDDADPGVRREAHRAVRRTCGSATAMYADDLAVVAASADRGVRPETFWAAHDLMLLGDPRWLDAVTAPPGRRRQWLTPWDGEVRWTPAVEAAVRERLADLVRHGPHPAVAELVTLLGGWGPGATDAVAELRAALPLVPAEASLALLRVGHDDPATARHLRALAASGGPTAVEAGYGVWRLTGDPQPLVDGLHAVLTGPCSAVPDGAAVAAAEAAVSGAGPFLTALLPTARTRLTGSAHASEAGRMGQVLAARLTIAAAGDVAVAVPTLRTVLAAGGPAAAAAAGLVGDTADPSVGHGPDRADLVPVLRGLLGDDAARVNAADALRRCGHPAGLIAPLVAAVEQSGSHRAVAVLVGMGAVAAVADLHRLAERDERIAPAGSCDVVWQDEALQAALRAAVVALRDAPGAGTVTPPAGPGQSPL